VQPPFQVVALHHQGAADLAVPGSLPGRSDVDQADTVGHRGSCLERAEPLQPGSGGGQQILDSAEGGF
jgi:hypothetical protein